MLIAVSIKDLGFQQFTQFNVTRSVKPRCCRSLLLDQTCIRSSEIQSQWFRERANL